jgi:polyphosphate kinase
VKIEETPPIALSSHEIFLNKELSWLAFARRVLELTESKEIPLLERVKFAGIMGMLHKEFMMKMMSRIKSRARTAPTKRSLDGRLPFEELAACRAELDDQTRTLSRIMNDQIRPELRAAGLPILDHDELDSRQQAQLRDYFVSSVLPILTPLAVDAEHPFPFISGEGLNLAVIVLDEEEQRERFVRVKIPTNRPRWVPVPGGDGVVPIEQIIARNLALLLRHDSFRAYLFRVTRGAGAAADDREDGGDGESSSPGRIIGHVTHELKARRFAGAVRLKVASHMPQELRRWLGEQIGVSAEDITATDSVLGMSDLLSLRFADRDDLHFPHFEPTIHPRLRRLSSKGPSGLFEEINRGDILLHHPYHSFDESVLRFLTVAAEDPQVLAIKLTIYRTSSDSPIVRALAEAARRGKQVAVLVEITARFDEAPNIAWGQLLEKEGVHVAYGVEKLKTHVKLALVVREEPHGLRSYVHIGTGNYHTGTARMYEDLGILSSDPELCRDVTLLFNQLTGAMSVQSFSKLIVAPRDMRARFIGLIRREAEHARAGRPSGIRAKMNQLQDPDIIKELYQASREGVPISLNVRGLCCIRPGVPGLSESIRVFSIVGRYLEHGRVYEFTNGGQPEYYLGSADWMQRNLDARVETIAPVAQPSLKHELAAMLDVYEQDNASRWDCASDGSYARRHPAPGEPRRAAQERFISLASYEQSEARPKRKPRLTPTRKALLGDVQKSLP